MRDLMDVIPIHAVCAVYINGNHVDKESLFTTHINVDYVTSHSYYGCCLIIEMNYPPVNRLKLVFENSEQAMEVSRKIAIILENAWALRMTISKMRSELETKILLALED